MGRRQSVSVHQTNRRHGEKEEEKSSESVLAWNRKPKPRAVSLQRCPPHLSVLGSSKLQLTDKAENSHHSVYSSSRKEHQHVGLKHAVTPPSGAWCKSISDPQKKSTLGDQSARDNDSDTDLSDSERVPVKPSGCKPSLLQLRPEVVVVGDESRRKVSDDFEFPDFLPPPFNAWSLRQLALLCNVHEHRRARARPAASLERYLQRLVQLERHQIHTAQEESGTRAGLGGGASNCGRASTITRLSSPKCILQCQRSFPLALATPCSCRATSGRSYSKGRATSGRSNSESRVLRLSSPVRSDPHLRRMEASGNLRTLSHDTSNRANSITAARDTNEMVSDRTGRGRRRRKRDEHSDKKQKERRGVSEYSGAADWTRATGFKDCEIKPDAVAAILDNLPSSKGSVLLSF
ncbi:uncharacterized protein LOC114463688 [Gouania willdenowi]|uniref:Uncharacterized LOC114463688 n=1 Tax=Gouania willdenowi TaxID=441366 RepID=A0A8C5NB66_GOUWI|nr:uncharacterized protein LOC114463688 [Gouania willdenowi]XP_028303199.1 uncharacterized protein LOC114463688 [Gouania willdenowi]